VEFQQEILDNVIVYTLQAYAQFLLGLRKEPEPEHEPVLYWTLDGLCRWLVEDILPPAARPVRRGQIITPAMVRYAIAHRLRSEESAVLEQRCRAAKIVPVDLSDWLTFEEPIIPCPKTALQQRTIFSDEERLANG
jgi:hypothetical protein